MVANTNKKINICYHAKVKGFHKTVNYLIVNFVLAILSKFFVQFLKKVLCERTKKVKSKLKG